MQPWTQGFGKWLPAALPRPAGGLQTAPLSLQGACLGSHGGHLLRLPQKGPYFPRDYGGKTEEQGRNQSTSLLFSL